MALTEQSNGIVPALLLKQTVDPGSLATTLRGDLAKLPVTQGGSEPELSTRFKSILAQAILESQKLRDEYVSTEHLLLSLVDEARRSPGARLLKEYGNHPRQHL